MIYKEFKIPLYEGYEIDYDKLKEHLLANGWKKYIYINKEKAPASMFINGVEIKRYDENNNP